MVLPEHAGTFNDVVAHVPELAESASLSVTVISGGLTNTSYLVDTDTSRLVVRISCGNSAVLGIDRTTEAAALKRAEEAGIAPEVLFVTEPEGHLVTRFASEARTLSIEEFVSPEMIPRVARTLRNVHSLDPVDGRFDPLADIERWMGLVEARGTEVPVRLGTLLDRVRETGRRSTARMVASDLVLCHNDPYHLNFLVDGGVMLIDWEYAGMGDPMYDLAGIAYMLDRTNRDLLLESYFGSAEPWMHTQLEALIPVFVCWNVVWCLVEMDGGVEDFDYLAHAEELLDWLPAGV